MSITEREEEYIECVAEIEDRPKEEVAAELAELKSEFINEKKSSPALWRMFFLLLRDHYMLGVMIDDFREDNRKNYEDLTVMLGKFAQQVSGSTPEEDDDESPKEEIKPLYTPHA
jgi:hypothetical protein